MTTPTRPDRWDGAALDAGSPRAVDPPRRSEVVGASRWAVLAVALAGLFTVSATITLLVVSLSTIATSLHSDASTLSWSITGPMLAFGLVGPAFGKAGDLWGHKRLFLFGLAGAGVFALATAVAWNAASLIVFRVLSASLGSATGPAAMAMINRLFRGPERVKALGYWSLTTAGAPVLGVVAGGPLVDAVGWRVIFVIQAPLCLLGFVLALVLMPETDRIAGARFDGRGAALLAAGVTSLLLATNRGAALGWTHPAVLAGFVLAPVCLYAFVRVERVALDPLLPLAWLRRRNIVGPLASQGLSNFAYMGGFILTPLLLEKGLGLTTGATGRLVIWRPLAFAIAAPLASRVTVRIGERVAGVVGAATVGASLLTLAAVTTTSSHVIVALGLALSGIGLGIASPALTAVIAATVAETDLGVAAAIQQLTTQIGAVVGSQLMVTIHDANVDSLGPIRSYGRAYQVGALVAAAAAGVAFVIRPTTRQRSTSRH